MSQDSFERLPVAPWFLVSPPETRPEDLPRKQLLQTLESHVDRFPITIIEAPSGFGKTTTLALWAKSRQGCTAWMTLGRDTKSTVQLLGYLVGALHHLNPDPAAFEELTVRAQNGLTDLNATLESIIDTLPADSRTTVVIDEGQETSQAALSDLVVPLARYSNGKITFVISGTHSLTRWFTKELANGQAHRFASTKLLLSLEELTELLDTRPASRVAQQLWRETGGWPVAVRLLLHGGADSPTAEGLRSHVSSSVLTDYIETVVLANLRDELRTFILDSIICDRMDVKLAAHVSGNPQAASLIDESLRNGLFLERTSEDGRNALYSWHTTFATSCREIAERTDPERYRRTHVRAAEWLSERYPADAIRHALESGDTSFAVTTIEDVWLQMVTNGDVALLENKCLQVQDLEAASILYIRAVCRSIQGDHVGADILKARAGNSSIHLPEDRTERTQVTRQFADVLLVSGPDDLDEALAEMESALEIVPLSRSQHIHARFLAALTHMKLRHKPHRAMALMSSVATNAETAGFWSVAHRASAAVVSTLTLAGQFTTAKKILAELDKPQETAESWDPFDGNYNTWSSAFIAFWQGDLERAANLFREIDAIGAPMTSDIGLGRMYFIYTAALSDDPPLLDEARTMLAKISDTDHQGIPWHSYKRVTAASLYLARGHRKAAVKQLSMLESHIGATTTRVIAAELWRRLGYDAQALAILSQIDPTLLASYSATTAQYTHAVITWEQGNDKKAHEILEACLDVAASEAIKAPFIRLGNRERSFFTAHAGLGTRHEHLVASLITEEGASDSAVPELSSRELEVYGYLNTTMTAAEIAEALFVSPATVRSHQASIYRKLGVTNRRDAVRSRQRIRR